VMHQKMIVRCWLLEGHVFAEISWEDMYLHSSAESARQFSRIKSSNPTERLKRLEWLKWLKWWNTNWEMHRIALHYFALSSYSPVIFSCSLCFSMVRLLFSIASQENRTGMAWTAVSPLWNRAKPMQNGCQIDLMIWDDLRWSELLEISTYIKIYQNDSVWYRMFLHKQTPRHISKSLRLRNLTTRNPIQFDLGQCGLTVPGCRELDNILLLHPNYRKALGMFGLHAENAEAITIHYISSHFKSFQGNHQIQGSIHRAVSCYALILCRIWDV
jgi:hypothetical protein